MSKTILITGSTDGIGLETAKQLYARGHKVLLHGRNEDKLAQTKSALLEINQGGDIQTYKADLSKLSDVEKLAEEITDSHENLDVLINNAGVFKAKGGLTEDGIELRFAVNSIAPYLLTKKFLPLLGENGRVVNLSSAAQATVDPDAITSAKPISDNAAYAQSKLLLTMWSRKLGLELADKGPLVVSVNPKSFLGSKMVKEAYGVAGGDLKEGADILIRAAVSEEFSKAQGQYFDNDIGRFSSPHPDALDDAKVDALVKLIDSFLANR
jgi:NAD(P)-dependent dehydrogenase (short-subunit alcohol dehydrogenase family)